MVSPAKDASVEEITSARAQYARILKEYYDKKYVRPRYRSECGTARPCPWVSCRYHLYLDVKMTGLIEIPFPACPPWRMKESCALDLVDRYPEGLTLLDIGDLFNVTREWIRQVESMAIKKLQSRKEIRHE
jgi:hypothetical protein